jgi:predicted O-methyltransferase YrrM
MTGMFFEVSDEVRKQFLRNREISDREKQIYLYEGLSVEVLAWMIAGEGYWESFDFVYIDGSHLAANVLSDAVMAWPLLKVGGVLAFDDYEWGNGSNLGAPKQAIDAFERIFHPNLDLLRDGWRKIWRKLG